MALYEIECSACGKKVEVLTDYVTLRSYTSCPCECGGERRLLISLPGKAQWLVDTGTASSPFKEKDNG